MLRVAALTSGRDMPSTRYRVRQYIEPLQKLGVRVREYCPRIDKWRPVPGKPKAVTNRQVLPIYAVWQAMKLGTRLPGVVGSYRYDATWLNKELLPGYLTLEPMLHRPLVFDLDDAVWLTSPWGHIATTAIAKRSEVVIAGNTFLADRFEGIAKKVVVIPTAVDSNKFRPPSGPIGDSQHFTLGWIGTSANTNYLLGIEDALCAFFERRSDCRLLIISDRAPSFRRLPLERVVFERWTEDTAHLILQRLDVGLMPLTDSEWARGKCALKMLQYMACGIPVIVSSVGMNKEILEMSDVGFGATSITDWYEAFDFLYCRRSEGRRKGAHGRELVTKAFDLEVVSRRVAEVFQGL